MSAVTILLVVCASARSTGAAPRGTICWCSPGKALAASRMPNPTQAEGSTPKLTYQRRPDNAQKHSRRSILRALPLAVSAGILGCDASIQRADLPPVTAPPIELVGAAPFTATPTTDQEPSAATRITVSEGRALQTGTTIRFAGWGTAAELTALEQSLKAFEDLQPYAELEVRLDNALADGGMRTALQAEIDVDVVRIAADDVFDLTTGGYLVPLDEFVARHVDPVELEPAVTTARSGPGGEVAALSVGASYLGVFYNASHLEMAGVEPPTSWDDSWSVSEFEDHARRLAISDENRVLRFGLAAVPSLTRPALADANGIGPNGAFFSPDQIRSTMQTETHARTLRRMSSWRTVSEFELGIAERSAAPFNGGLTALYIDSSDFTPLIRPVVRWGFAPLPSWSGGASLTEGTEFCVAVNAASLDVESAWRLAQHFLEPDAQRALARNDVAVPFRKPVLNDPAFRDPNRPPADRSALRGAVAHDLRTPSNPGSKGWHALTQSPIEMVRSGATDADIFLATADELITRQLTAYEWSIAKDVIGYRRPLSIGNVLLREFDERIEAESAASAESGPDR